MLKRIITSLVAFPILAAFVIYGGAPLQLALFILAIIGMHEMYMAISKKILPIHYVGYAFAAIYYLLLSNLGPVTSFFYSISIAKYFSTYILIFSSLFVITLFIMVVCLHEKINIIDCAVTAMGFFYVAFMMSFIYLTRQHSYGQYFVWLIFIAAWGCDTGAYFVGITMGKHKLTPKLSPKKTIEGAIGGVIGAALIALIYGFSVTRISGIQGELSLTLFCTVAAGVGSIFAQFGDLAASAIKRYTGIKDYGKIIPGHGGVLDRFDSVLFTAPVVYGVTFILINFFR